MSVKIVLLLVVLLLLCYPALGRVWVDGEAIVSDEADCALVDSAQLGELPTLDKTGAIKSVWASEKLPGMVIAAFPHAPTVEQHAFKNNLEKLCLPTAALCQDLGIIAFRSSNVAEYNPMITAYDK